MSVLLSLLDPTSVLVGGVLVLCLLWWLSTRQPPGLPPGPGHALPLLGHLHLLPKDPRTQLWAWKRQYGDVVSLYLGGQLTVVLASYSAIREALVTFADVFSDRPHIFTIDEIVKGKGIVSASGPLWKEQRKTALEILRHMGMGRNQLADKIQEEITHYMQAIRDHQGAPMDIGPLTQVSVSNNICSITLGKRFQYDDKDFRGYLQCINDNFKLLAGTAVLNFLPALRFLPGDPFKIKKVMARSDTVYAFIDQHISRHQNNLAARGGKREEGEAEVEKEKGKEEVEKGKGEEGEEDDTDFIYSYLRQIRKQKACGNTSSTLDEENLQKGVGDLFAAGTETTSSALQWALLLFLYHPHVEDRCFQEISDVIGPHRQPAMSDRPQLPYVEATIMEVLRKGDIVPLSVQHGTSRDVIFRGYVIPKDAVVIPFLSSVLQDPEVWGDPENFRPERFIGPDGKVTKPEEFIPFSTGRRVCLGESLARMELFLYLTTLLQHFRFMPPEDGQLPSLEGVFGLTHTPQPYKIRAVPRK